MKALKNLGLGLLGLLLFFALSVFGLALMLNQTLLNPRFVTSEFNRLDISPLATELISQQASQGGLPTELQTSLISATTELQPLIKEQVSVATHSVYDYLLGKEPSIDLAVTLRESLLNTDFIVAAVDKVDLAPLVKEYLYQQLQGTIPAWLTDLIKKPLDEAIEKTVVELKPWLKVQVKVIAEPSVEYLLGQRQSFSASISLEPVKESLRRNVFESVLNMPELTVIPRSMLEQMLEQFYQDFAAQSPSTYEVNESVFGADMRAQITRALTDAQEGLELSRQYVRDFQLAYTLSIVFILLLVAGIVLIHREVKGATRSLGTIILTYGAFEYVGILIAKYFTKTQMPFLGMPSFLQDWLPQFISHILFPLEIFSLVVLIVGVVLLVVSFVYQPRQAEV